MLQTSRSSLVRSGARENTHAYLLQKCCGWARTTQPRSARYVTVTSGHSLRILFTHTIAIRHHTALGRGNERQHRLR